MSVLRFEDSGESDSLPELHVGIARLDSDQNQRNLPRVEPSVRSWMFLAGQLFWIVGGFQTIAVNRMDVLLQPRQYVCFLPLI